MTNILIEAFYILFLAFAFYMVFIKSIRKKESDRQEALELSKTAALSGRLPYNLKTSRNNPITTGIFSILISIPFKDLRWLTMAFWAWTAAACYLNGVHPYIILFLITIIFRTMYYRLEEVYFIFVPLYYAVSYFGAWGLLVLLLWRNPFTSFQAFSKPLDGKALVLDYCLILPLGVLVYLQ